jgi:hypothetical protein
MKIEVDIKPTKIVADYVGKQLKITGRREGAGSDAYDAVEVTLHTSDVEGKLRELICPPVEETKEDD